MTTTTLAHYDVARAALEKASTFDEVAKINDRAMALAAYARQSKNVDMEAQCVEIRRRAERRIGEMLAEARKAGQFDKGGRPKKTGVSKTPVSNLAGQSIDKNLAKRARKMAQLSKNEFESGLRKMRDKIKARSDKVDREFKNEANTSSRSKPTPSINSVLMKLEQYFERELVGKHVKCLEEIVKFKNDVDPAYAHDFLDTAKKYLNRLNSLIDELGDEFGAVIDVSTRRRS